MSIVIIGDSHVARLRRNYNFKGATLFGVSGVTSSQLSNHLYKKILHEVILIMCGGNDVCDNRSAGRRAVTNEIVMKNLNG